MSQLINTLNHIESLIQKYKPDESERLKPLPDLTLEQIEEKLSSIPYRVSTEIIDLYEWHHSGHKPFICLLDVGQFLDLDEAISTAIDWGRNGYLNMSAFPLFVGEDAIVYWTTGNGIQEETAPIWSNDEATFPPHPDAMSLTLFLQNKINRDFIKIL